MERNKKSITLRNLKKRKNIKKICFLLPEKSRLRANKISHKREDTIKELGLKKYSQTLGYLIQNAAEERFPFYASFKVTLRCQYTCEFCNCWRGPKNDLSTEDIKKILQNLGRSSIHMVSFEGGDPLMREDLLELLQESHRQPFYTMLTTSQKDLLSYPWKEFEKYVDFLEVSIDEGHGNLHYFDILEDINQYDMVLCVQTVVRDKDVSEMEWKVKRCSEAGSKILLMPAVQLEEGKYHFPALDEMEMEIRRLKKAYPGVIITPNSYFRRMQWASGGCSPNSILIDADGSLIYPCRTLENKTVKLQETELMDYLVSTDAQAQRETMQYCTKRCGWYQHFATSSFTNPLDFWDAFSPYFHDFLQKTK
jgi:MoaA/NifB/PqqE/SkfB family radical SAM enzyme